MRPALIIIAVFLCLAVTAALIGPVRRLLHPLVVRLYGTHTVAQRLDEFAAARARVRERCDPAGIQFPPSRVVFVALKNERRLEVYAGPDDDSLRRVCSYPILAASGSLGPKLREGDRQVPEGIYAVEMLNPDSRFHVALRVGYPNDFDRRVAREDGRARLGGDIMIHGGSSSVGCLAVGDDAAEDLFVLAATTGIENVTVVLAPVDLRVRGLPRGMDAGWRSELYVALSDRLRKLPLH
jgi:hypothetical protein